MKKLLLAIIAASLCVPSLADVLYDQYSYKVVGDEHQYRWTGIDEDGGFNRIYAINYNPYKSTDLDFSIYFAAQEQESFRYYACDKIRWLVDGELLDIDQPRLSSSRTSYFSSPTRKQFEKMANAESISYLFCGKLYRFGDKELEGINRVYREYARNHL